MRNDRDGHSKWFSSNPQRHGCCTCLSRIAGVVPGRQITLHSGFSHRTTPRHRLFVILPPAMVEAVSNPDESPPLKCVAQLTCSLLVWLNSSGDTSMVKSPDGQPFQPSEMCERAVKNYTSINASARLRCWLGFERIIYRQWSWIRKINLRPMCEVVRNVCLCVFETPKLWSSWMRVLGGNIDDRPAFGVGFEAGAAFA